MGVDIVCHRLRIGLFCYYRGLATEKVGTQHMDFCISHKMNKSIRHFVTLVILTVLIYNAVSMCNKPNSAMYVAADCALSNEKYAFSQNDIFKTTYDFVDVNKLLNGGDIHKNPGPVKNPCGICKRPVARNHRALRCAGCFQDIHIKCGDVSPASYQQFVEQNLQWLCNGCNIPAFNFNDSFFNASNQSISSELSESDVESVNCEDEGFFSVNHLRNVRTTYRNNFLSSYLNINSLRYKFDELSDLVTRNALDFICVAETKLDSSYFDGIFTIANYRPFRKDNTSLSGGLFAFVRSEIPCQRRPDLECDKLESLCVEVTLANTKWLVACLYRHPQMSNNLFEDEMTTLVDKIIALYDRYIIMGDLNYDMTRMANNRHALLDVCNLFDLKNVISHPTCFKTSRGTLLDVILVHDQRHLQSCGVTDTGLSDHHRLIYSLTKTHAPRPTKREITYISYKTLNEEAYLQDLENAPFHVASVFDNVDDQLYFTQTLLNEITNEHLPIKTKTVKANAPPYMNRKLRKSCMDKARYRHRYQKFPTKENWEKYRLLRNMSSKLKRKSIRTFF